MSRDFDAGADGIEQTSGVGRAISEEEAEGTRAGEVGGGGKGAAAAAEAMAEPAPDSGVGDAQQQHAASSSSNGRSNCALATKRRQMSSQASPRLGSSVRLPLPLPGTLRRAATDLHLVCGVERGVVRLRRLLWSIWLCRSLASTSASGARQRVAAAPAGCFLTVSSGLSSLSAAVALLFASGSRGDIANTPRLASVGPHWNQSDS